MLTTLLLALALATAGADTTAWTSLDSMNAPWANPVGLHWHGTDSEVNPPALPDSLCAKCGKKCETVQVPCPNNDPMYGCLVLHYGRRCPDHGRHVEWLGSLATGKWMRRVDPPDSYCPTCPDSIWNITVADSIEIGLRENGVVVWRKKGEKP